MIAIFKECMGKYHQYLIFLFTDIVSFIFYTLVSGL